MPLAKRSVQIFLLHSVNVKDESHIIDIIQKECAESALQIRERDPLSENDDIG